MRQRVGKRITDSSSDENVSYDDLKHLKNREREK